MKLILMVLAISLSCYSYADSMRCGNDLITEGDSKFEVLQDCGEPLFQESIYLGRGSSYTRYHGILYPTVTDIVEDRWTYDLGGGRYLRALIFRNGKLIRIELGDRQ